MATHHSRTPLCVLVALVVAACGGEIESPTALDSHGSGAAEGSPRAEVDPAPPETTDDPADSPAVSSETSTKSLAPAPADLCSELVNAAPRGSLVWEEKQPHDAQMEHPWISILAYAQTAKGPDGKPRHELSLVASTLADPDAWMSKGIRPTKEFRWTVVLSSPTAPPGVGAYVDPDLREYHAGSTMACDGTGGAGGSSTGSPTMTTVTITERTATVVRGVIETEWDRVTFEAPIVAEPSRAEVRSFCCLEDAPSSGG